MHVIEVLTGEVHAGRTGDVLKASAIGSCIALSFYCLSRKLGAMAHIMLPGSCPPGMVDGRTRYAVQAVDELLLLLQGGDCCGQKIEACLVGGANVLKNEDGLIAKNNLDSVVEILREKKIVFRAQAVGGTARRSATFNVGLGSVFFTEGDGEEQFLWAADERGMRLWIEELEQVKSELKRSIGDHRKVRDALREKVHFLEEKLRTLEAHKEPGE